ncbi:MAG: hypothetical protein ACI92Z_001229 [Paracoccaceae bacterium]|jgi:hypothetical protein
MTISNFTSGLTGWSTTNGTETFETADGDPGGSIRGTEGGVGT